MKDLEQSHIIYSSEQNMFVIYRIRVTLDCQAVNKAVYATHEPIPTPDELRHYLGSSDHFSMLDMTNCYYQFEIKPGARKLYAFRSPWGIY